MIAFVGDVLAPPEGPGTPFGDSTLIIVDSIRLAVFVLGTVVILCTPFAMARSQVPGQWVRLLGAGGLVLAAIGTEADHFGDYAHWRLFFHVFCVVALAWGYWSLFTKEAPAPFSDKIIHPKGQDQ